MLAVLDKWLEGRKEGYLVGDKCTYADLSFVNWFKILPMIFDGDDSGLAKDFPNWHAWFQRLLARPAVKKVLDEQAALSKDKE